MRPPWSFATCFIETATGDPTMSEFRVSFYKTLQDASGRSWKHLQRQLDLTSDSPSGALVAAERLLDPHSLEADCVEVADISPATHHARQVVTDLNHQK
jgi:hypothetical protein